MRSAGSNSSIRLFGRDTTERLSCRKGEFLIWLQWPDLFAAKHEVMDFWRLSDGDYVLITNRIEDIPPWFEIHPLETSGIIALKMTERLESEYRPSDPMDGPNMWKVLAGDRIVWIQVSQNAGVDENIRKIFEFEQNVLVVGNPDRTHDLFNFDPVCTHATDEMASAFRLGINTATGFGSPRTLAADRQWRLG